MSAEPKKAPRQTKAAREQLALLLELGALSATTGKGVVDDARLNPQTIGSLRKHKLTATADVVGGRGKRPVYWLTPLGLIAAQANAPATPRKARAKFAATDLVGRKLITKDAIEKPGFYRMASDVYHADPCPTPALSSTLAAKLVEFSARHAWYHSPRCTEPGSAYVRSNPTYPMDIGSAVHAFAFGDPEHDVVWIDAPDFRDSRTKGWRDAARAKGKTPILKHDKPRVLHMAEVLQPVLERELGCSLGDAYGEVVIAAQVRGAWVRTRSDLLRGDLRVILDVKTTAISAHPDAAAGRLFDGAHIQEALTHRVLDELDPENAGGRVFKFVSIEQDEPHGVSTSQIDGDSAAIALQQADYAIDEWAKGAAEKGEWAGYAPGVHVASMPAWKQIQWRMRAISLGIADEQGEPT